MSNPLHLGTYRHLLEQLRKARLKAGLTQVQVAKKFGKPQSFISKIESGERKVGVLELEKFAKLYKKPVSYFYKSP